MRKILFMVTMSLFFGCNSDDNCGEVIDKVINNGRFLLVIRFDDGASTSENEFSGELVDDIEVDEQTFSSFEEGDNYCIE
ncbi:MAG: hypothetical protein VXY01_02530 [Bacteroidota bacterium]|nr:hypothetical protein [Bacteroidota bacterium]